MISSVPPIRCLVICPLPIVAEDLAEIIRERLGPGAAETCLDPAHAAQRLSAAPEGVVVFAALRLQQLTALDLDRQVAARGGRLVLVGGSLSGEEAGARGWLLLPEPFSSEMVEDLLVALGV